ncbi:DNA ligase 1-like [Hyperolius riggenbachi]|uniref:DNA ligase 1-like n=1 Tax=Hyperolius riggenbachi TaxID=752182 RepID=UPI0035A39598
MKRRQKSQGGGHTKKNEKGRKSEHPQSVSMMDKNTTVRADKLNVEKSVATERNTRSQKKKNDEKPGTSTAVHEQLKDDHEKVIKKPKDKKISKEDTNTNKAENVQTKVLDLTQYRDNQVFQTEESSSESNSEQEDQEDSDASLTVKCARSIDDSGSSVLLMEEEEKSGEEQSLLMGTNRKRAFKFTEEENLELCAHLCPCFKYIFTREQNAEELRKKEKVWEDIALQVSSVSQIDRSAYSCRRRFQDCKSKVQDKMSREKFTTVHYNKWKRKLRDAILRNPNLGRRKGTKRKKKSSAKKIVYQRALSTENESELEIESIENVVSRSKVLESLDEEEHESKEVALPAKNKKTNKIGNGKEGKKVNDNNSSTKIGKKTQETQESVTPMERKRKEDENHAHDENISEGNCNVCDNIDPGNENESSQRKVTITVDMHKHSETTKQEVTKLVASEKKTEMSKRPKRSATKNYTQCNEYVYDACVYSLEKKNKEVKEKFVSGIVEYEVSSNDDDKLGNDTPSKEIEVQGKISDKTGSVVEESEVEAECVESIENSDSNKESEPVSKSISQDISDAMLQRTTTLHMDRMLNLSKNIYELMSLLLENVKYVHENQLEILKRQSEILDGKRNPSP